LARFTDDLNAWKFGASGLLDEDTFFKDFHEMAWSQLYAVSQYIPKYKKGSNRMSYVAPKGIDESDTNNPMPYTNAVRRADVIFGLMTAFIELQKFFIRFRIVMSNIRFCIAFCLAICISITIPVIKKTISFTVLKLCFRILCDDENSMIFRFIGYNCRPVGGGAVACDDLEKDTNSCGKHIIKTLCEDAQCDCCTEPQSTCSCPHGPLYFTVKVPSFDIDCCDSAGELDRWECCRKLDLAIDRKVIKYSFMDAWLTGSAYLPQFKHKRKIKKDGEIRDKFCGAGGYNSGSDNYWKDKCGTQRDDERGAPSIPSERRCLVRSPGISTKSGFKSPTYQQNRYVSGAKDINDYVYCPETYPTKIVNLGRSDACEDIVDRIDRCIASDECTLNLWKNQGCDPNTLDDIYEAAVGTDGAGTGGRGRDLSTCFTGTFYDTGYDTEQWVRLMGPSSYDEATLLVVYFLFQYGNCSIRKLFKGGGGCNEREFELQYWTHIREVSKIHMEINPYYYTDTAGNEVEWWHEPGNHPSGSGPGNTGNCTLAIGQSPPNPNYNPNGQGISYVDNDLEDVVGFGIDTDLAKKYSPSSSYLIPNFPSPDGDTKPGDQTVKNHYRNTPYYYFGLLPGKTAIDRLRKEYLYNETE
jgi:hypothetical protein